MTTATSLKDLKLAIIDDDEPFGKVVGLLIGQPMDWFMGVTDFKDNNYDIVFCDLRLRETWGIESIIEVRKLTRACIIVLTGLAHGMLSATDMLTLLNAGAGEVFSKDVVRDPMFKDMIWSVYKKGLPA